MTHLARPHLEKFRQHQNVIDTLDLLLCNVSRHCSFRRSTPASTPSHSRRPRLKSPHEITAHLQPLLSTLHELPQVCTKFRRRLFTTAVLARDEWIGDIDPGNISIHIRGSWWQTREEALDTLVELFGAVEPAFVGIVELSGGCGRGGGLCFDIWGS